MSKNVKHAGRIIFDLTGTNSFAVRNGTELYYTQLRAAYIDIKQNSQAPYLLFAFVTLCAATLEYSLNYLILEHCIDKYGPHNYKRYWETYINIQFKNKLYLVPTLLSDGNLVVNSDSPSIKKLEELILLRNRILHNKESLEAIETPNLGAIVENGELIVPIEGSQIDFSFTLKDNPVESLNSNQCLEFGDALGEFRTYIMKPSFDGPIVENPLLNLCTW